jgi:hypothetical protein
MLDFRRALVRTNRFKGARQVGPSFVPSYADMEGFYPLTTMFPDVVLSIQGSAHTYCSPRSGGIPPGDYTALEVAIMGSGSFLGLEDFPGLRFENPKRYEELLEVFSRALGDDVFGYVPVAEIQRLCEVFRITGEHVLPGGTLVAMDSNPGLKFSVGV